MNPSFTGPETSFDPEPSLSPAASRMADALRSEVVDPDDYAARVSSFPSIRAARYITVPLAILDEEKAVLTNLTVQFDIRKPRRLLRFLEALGAAYSEEEDFDIMPAAWKGRGCRVRLAVVEFRKEGEEPEERNVIAEFYPAEGDDDV